MSKYQLIIEFESDEDPDSHAMREMIMCAFVQVQDAESIETRNVETHLLRQQEPKWEKVW